MPVRLQIAYALIALMIAAATALMIYWRRKWKTKRHQNS